MDRLEYLKNVINTTVIEDKNWYLLAFGIPILKESDSSNIHELTLFTQPDGLYTVLFNKGERTEVKLTGYKSGEPLFNFQEIIDVDSSWLKSIKGKLKTKIGNLIINALVLYPSFKDKFPYINEPITIPKIEKELANLVVSDQEAKPTDISVSEMVKAFDRFTFLTNLSILINIAATKKTITAPPGIEKIKKELLKEYEGKLDDPVKLVELEQKLTKIDNDYLKDDIAANKIFNKKSKTARQKMFLIYGNTMDFIKKSGTNVIIPSLSEGLSTKENDFYKYINDLRIGSYSRGSSTQLGGYTYKVLQRSLSGLSVSQVPCDTKIGLRRLITKNNASKISNRYIKINNNWKLVENTKEAEKYIGKIVEIRSTMYCTSPGNTVCYKCLNEAFKHFPDGVTNIASELSSTLLSLFMKLMHGNVTENAELEINDLAT